MEKIYILIFTILLSASIFANQILEKNFTILFTGETHGMIYPCKCETTPSGGISRRETLIKNIKKSNITFLLDAGGFFAGTKFDLYIEGEVKDKARTLANINAMQLMNYDAVAIGDDEFIWGLDFLKNNLINKIPTVSCNLFYADGTSVTSPYKILEKNGISIGVIGVTSPDLLQNNSDLIDKIKVENPIISTQKTVEKIRMNVDYIVVLSHLGENSSIELTNKIKNIDLVINSHKRNSIGDFGNFNETLFTQFTYQGKSIGSIDVNIKNSQKPSSIYKNIPVTQEIEEDDKMKEILNNYENQNTAAPKKVKLELFVMSYCPYGQEAENEIFSLLKETDNLIDFEIHYIIDKKDTTFISSHGENELDENLKQLSIFKQFPDKFWNYLFCRNKNLQDTRNSCLNEAGIDIKELDIYMNENIKKILKEESDLTELLHVNSSPTLFINHNIYQGKIKKDLLLREICRILPNLKSCENIPECFNSEDCDKTGMLGKCENPGKKDAKCTYIKDKEVVLTILYSSTMVYPNYYPVLNNLNPLFPGLKTDFVSLSSTEGKELVNKHKINTVPYFIFNNEITETNNYLKISNQLKKNNDKYSLDLSGYNIPEIFLNTPKIDNHIDVYISPIIIQSYIILDALQKLAVNNKAFNLEIHYMVYSDNGNLTFMHGLAEKEEALRQIAIKIYHNDKFIEYLNNKKNTLESSYWEEPIKAINLDPEIIKKQSNDDKTKSILFENSEKVKFFNMRSEVTIVINNNERIPILNRKQFSGLIDKLSVK
ncbi:hypothetical protein HZA55_02700 [Candidatus Poribacteria bacterium]|nr:hypothetical protein [Candidatus Poribacteria bacterium]